MSDLAHFVCDDCGALWAQAPVDELEHARCPACGKPAAAMFPHEQREAAWRSAVALRNQARERDAYHAEMQRLRAEHTQL